MAMSEQLWAEFQSRLFTQGYAVLKCVLESQSLNVQGKYFVSIPTAT